MITQSQIYWLTRCDEIKHLMSSYASGLFGPLSVALLVACITAVSLGTFTGNKSYDMFAGKTADELQAVHARLLKWSRGFLVAFFASVGGCLGMHTAAGLTPTTKEMAAIVVIPRIANSQAVNDLGEGVVVLAKEWLEELRPKKQEKPHDK